MIAEHRSRPDPARCLRLLVVAASLLVAVTGCTKTASDGAAPGTTTPSTTASGKPTIPNPLTLQTQGTLWPGSQDPCSLVNESEVVAITRFDVKSGKVDSKLTDGQPVQACVFAHRAAGAEGGSVSVTILPPGTDYAADRGNITSATDITGLGKAAYAGHFAGGIGNGTNAVVVDMGNGGFSLGVLVFQDLHENEVLDLARTVASRWKPTT